MSHRGVCVCVCRCARARPPTSLLVGEHQRVSAAAGELDHPGLLRLGKGQRHRGRLQHVVVAPHCRHKVYKLSDSGTSRFHERLRVCPLTAAFLRALESQLGVFVEAHAPHLGHVIGCRGDEREAVTAGRRGDLRKTHRAEATRDLLCNFLTYN